MIFFLATKLHDFLFTTPPSPTTIVEFRFSDGSSEDLQSRESLGSAVIARLGSCDPMEFGSVVLGWKNSLRFRLSGGVGARFVAG